jgi:hypothetical protein
MKNISLKDWAAVAEIVGTAGIIISLLFVAHSINRNTELVQSAHSTLMYELSAVAADEQVADGDYAIFSAKRSYGLEFQDKNEAKFLYGLTRYLTHWELLISRHDDGLVDDDVYLEWNEYYGYMIARDMDIEWWDAVKVDYAQELVDAVDATYAEK